MNPLRALPRQWVFPEIRGLRGAGRGTYHKFELDSQPNIADDADDGLEWLEEELPKSEWTIEHGERGQQVRALDVAGLEMLAHGLPRLPESLRRFAERRDLQVRIRSATACYLDLADFATRTSTEGWLVHVLSDQQWTAHWLLYIDASGHEAVVHTPEPIGFGLPDDWDEPPPRTIDPRERSLDLVVCADTFAEFLYLLGRERNLLRTHRRSASSWASRRVRGALETRFSGTVTDALRVGRL